MLNSKVWGFHPHHDACVRLRDPRDCSPPGSSVHGILQARILEGDACPPPGDLSDPGIEPASLAAAALRGRFFTAEPSGKPFSHHSSKPFFNTSRTSCNLTQLRLCLPRDCIGWQSPKRLHSSQANHKSRLSLVLLTHRREVPVVSSLLPLLLFSHEVLSDSVTPRTAARQAPRFPTIFRSLLKFTSTVLGDTI